MAETQHITLRELQRRVKAALEGQFALPVWVNAEISEIKVNYSGHCYLELVEKGGDNGVPTAQARAVVWRSNYPRIAGYFEAETGQRLAAGIKILAKALVTYHELYGFSLQITDIDPSCCNCAMVCCRCRSMSPSVYEGSMSVICSEKP